MRFLHHLILAFFLCLSCVVQAQEPVPVHDIVSFKSIKGELVYYSAPRKEIIFTASANGSFTAAHKGTPLLQLPFKKFPEKDAIDRGNFLDDYLFRFVIVNNKATPDSFIFYSGVVLHSDIYRVDSATGALYPLTDPYNYTAQVSNQQVKMPYIRLQQGETQTLIVKPAFRYYNFNDWNPQLVREDHLTLLNYTLKIKPELSYLFISLFFLGIMLTMFVYAMIKAYQTRLKEFLFYGFSVLFFFLYFTYQFTLLFNFLDWYHGLDIFVKQFLQVGGYIFYMLFATYFLDIPRKLPRLQRVTNAFYIILFLYLAAVCATAFNDKYFALNMQMFNLVRLLMLLYGVYAVILLFHSKLHLGQYVAYGSLAVTLFSALAFYFSNVPARYGAFFLATGGPITLFKLGLLIEQVCFTLGLAKKSQLEEGYRIKAVEMLRIDNEKKEFEKFMAVMETKEKERTRIAQEIHDDIGSGLTTIRLLSEIARGKGGNGHSAEMEKISASANELIENMNEIIWSFNAKNDTLPNLVAYIRRYVVAYFEFTDIKVRINIPAEMPSMQISGDLRRSVFLVIKESLHNIMKHAKATEISLQVEINNALSIRLKDNGRGFVNDEVKLFSNGLRSMKERMENIGGKFNISGNNGTEVALSLPI